MAVQGPGGLLGGKGRPRGRDAMGMTTATDLLERQAHAAWTRIPGAGPRRMAALRDHFGGLAEAWRAPAAALGRVSGVGVGHAGKMAEARAGLDPAALWAADADLGARVVLHGDPAYPGPLLDLADPPLVLWAFGAWPPPAQAIAIVGARAASPYGERLARRLGHDLAAAEVAVVSGVAEGVDRAAHEGALDAPGGWTVGVLGCGFRHVYPAHHRGLYRAIASRGTLLTEFPPEAPPHKGSFPRRNRLIAALSRGTVVVEARAKSGSLITVDFALELGREVFAVPGLAGAAGSEGPHALLRDGATLVERAEDVLRACGWEAGPAPAPEVPLTGAAAAVWAAIGDEPVGGDRLAALTGLAPGALGATLVGLELAGRVRSLPGGRWARG